VALRARTQPQRVQTSMPFLIPPARSMSVSSPSRLMAGVALAWM
jgi:hypothetical protein